MPGYWRRPITRMYNYNLDLGENYYSHVRDHVSAERRERGETPGALSFSERLSRRYCGDDRVGGVRPSLELTDFNEMFSRYSIGHNQSLSISLTKDFFWKIVELTK